jgi:hypothetical protein
METPRDQALWQRMRQITANGSVESTRSQIDLDDHSRLSPGEAGTTPSCRICAKTSTTPQVSASRPLTKRKMKISL